MKPIEEPWVAPTETITTVTDKFGGITLERPHGRGWFMGFAIAFLFLCVLVTAVSYLFLKGVGIWGIQVPVAWGVAIANFVWWIGIGHAGTLISAILLLLHQKWRNSINRSAEAMTLFAVACAGLFPLLHLGRPWLFYWLVPYPSTMGVWPQFRSPLIWDFFAVSTYATISLVFWYVGLVPDLASIRDRARRPLAKWFYGLLSLGWRGSARHWHRFESLYVLLAGLATPLVVSVHTIVSFDFAVAVVPGWHSTIFPPYFVAGAIYSGFAMVLTLLIPLRAAYGLHPYITERHLDVMAKVMLTTGLMVAYGYVAENFIGWYSGNEYEWAMTVNRWTGHYQPVYLGLLMCNVVIPQVLWFQYCRRSAAILFAVSIIINVGMWLERYMIVVTSLYRDFVPSAWHVFSPTRWDWLTLAGSGGLFLTLFYLFIRYLPFASAFEIREMIAEEKSRG